jgi:hypothetical protein
MASPTSYSGDDWPTIFGFLWLMLLPCLFAYRLAAAYRHYLRFDHAGATAVASQVIVALAAFTAFINMVLLR